MPGPCSQGTRWIHGRLRQAYRGIDLPVTLTGKCRTPSAGRFGHPQQDRGLSIREAALLQGFPPEYQFDGTFDSKYLQIGNAVPPLVAKVLPSTCSKRWYPMKRSESHVHSDKDVLAPVGPGFAVMINGIKRKRYREEALWRMIEKVTAIDLFCGAGGLSLGLMQAGFDVRAAVDNDPMAVRTYRENVGSHVIEASLTEMAPEQLLRVAGLEPGECTLLAGGPPCQGFSVKRRGDRDDPRNDLLLEFFRYVDTVEPRFFLVENVKGLLSRHGRPYLNAFIRQAEDRGYRCHVGELDAVDFGVPQFRPRAFLVGEFGWQGRQPFEFPFATVSCGERRMVKDAIGDLPSPPEDGTPHPGIGESFSRSQALEDEPGTYPPHTRWRWPGMSAGASTTAVSSKQAGSSTRGCLWSAGVG